jgi:hypothetical protein
VTPLAPVLTYARLLRESHALISQGKGDTPEAEALADQMDEPWYALTAQEQQRMRGLSADLHALREGGPKRVEMSPDQYAQWQVTYRDAVQKVDRGDVDDALTFLRQPIPSNWPSPFIRLLQGRCWDKLGDPETASLFGKEVERTNLDQPANSQ